MHLAISRLRETVIFCVELAQVRAILCPFLHDQRVFFEIDVVSLSQFTQCEGSFRFGLQDQRLNIVCAVPVPN